MKGKATITLTDAKTGKVISCSEEHNLVTNALTNIFNPCQYATLHSFNYSSLFAGGLPMWKNLLSGVMLLGNNVEEDPDNILLGSETIPIATAGSEYAGTNVYRGSLNLNETYKTENGYHFTWDFGTDKANGTIRCVALTSKMFGDAGFHSEEAETGSFLVNPVFIEHNQYEPTTLFENGTGQYVGTFEPGVHLFMGLDHDGNLEFRKYRSVDPSALYINDVTGLTEASQPFWTYTVTPDISIRYDDRFFFDPETKIVYYFGESEIVSATSMNITFTGISIESFATVVTKTVTIPKRCTNYYLGAVWKGHIFYLTPDGLSEFDMDGSLIAEHEAPYAQTTLFFVYNGCLMSQSPTGFIYCYSWGETTSTALMKYVFPVQNVDFKPPYAAVCRRKRHEADDDPVTHQPCLSILSPYMATINNLSQPIVKTSEHTLKISYDITN